MKSEKKKCMRRIKEEMRKKNKNIWKKKEKKEKEKNKKHQRNFKEEKEEKSEDLEGKTRKSTKRKMSEEDQRGK